MTQSSEQLTNSGPTSEYLDQPLSATSPPTTTSAKKRKARQPKASKTGSNSQPTIHPSKESENESSLQSASEDVLLRVKDQATADKRRQANNWLGVKDETLAQNPKITPLLKKASGGLKALLDAMRFAADDPDISLFLAKYDAVPVGYIGHASWEAVAISAGVNIRHLLGAIQVAAVNYFGNTSRLIAVSAHPKITKSRVKYGLLPSGEKDRNALDIQVGALPQAKGPTFIGNAVFKGGGGTTPQGDPAEIEEGDIAEAVEIGDDVERLFPESNEVQELLVPIRQKLLKE